MYPLSLQELRSDNTAYVFRSIYNLIILNLLWSIAKRSKELSKLQCFWDFSRLSHKFKEKTIFFSRTPLLRTPAITDTKSSPRGCPQLLRESTVFSAGFAQQLNWQACDQKHPLFAQRLWSSWNGRLKTEVLNCCLPVHCQLKLRKLGVLLRQRIVKSRTHFSSNG